MINSKLVCVWVGTYLPWLHCLNTTLQTPNDVTCPEQRGSRSGCPDASPIFICHQNWNKRDMKKQHQILSEKQEYSKKINMLLMEPDTTTV